MKGHFGRIVWLTFLRTSFQMGLTPVEGWTLSGKRSGLEEVKASERSEWVKREKKRNRKKRLYSHNITAEAPGGYTMVWICYEWKVYIWLITKY